MRAHRSAALVFSVAIGTPTHTTTRVGSARTIAREVLLERAAQGGALRLIGQLPVVGPLDLLVSDALATGSCVFAWSNHPFKPSSRAYASPSFSAAAVDKYQPPSSAVLPGARVCVRVRSLSNMSTA